MMKHTKYFNPSYITMIEEDKIYHGHWWLPEAPEERIAGVLYLNKKGGIRLNLFGMFSRDETQEFGLRLTDHDIILGQFTPGLSIATIVRCKEREREGPYLANVAKDSVQRFIADKMLFGRHIPKLEDLIFSNFEFSTTYLPNWANVRLLDIDFKDKSTVVTSLPNVTTTVSGEEYEIAITSYVHTSLGGDYNFTQDTSISVNLTKPISWTSFEERFQNPLLDLIQFGSSFLNSINFLNTITAEGDTLKMISTGRFERITKTKDYGLHKSLFLLSDLADDAPAFINTWIDFHTRSRHIFRLYFDSLYVGFQFPVSKFLNIIQAIESYHAERKETPFVLTKKEEFKNNKQSVMECLTDKFESLRNWIKTELSYFTVLRTRLEELINEANPVISELGADHQVFISRVMDTRNYYTHYDPRKKMKAAVDIELSTMTHVLSILLAFHVLVECGMSKERASEVLTKRGNLNSLKQVIKDHKLWKAESLSTDDQK